MPSWCCNTPIASPKNIWIGIILFCTQCSVHVQSMYEYSTVHVHAMCIRIQQQEEDAYEERRGVCRRPHRVREVRESWADLRPESGVLRHQRDTSHRRQRQHSTSEIFLGDAYHLMHCTIQYSTVVPGPAEHWTRRARSPLEPDDWCRSRSRRNRVCFRKAQSRQSCAASQSNSPRASRTYSMRASSRIRALHDRKLAAPQVGNEVCDKLIFDINFKNEIITIFLYFLNFIPEMSI